VVAGQQAENLLDFDEIDEPSSSTSNMFTQSSNTAATQSAIASAAKSTNPLDELMDLFGGSTLEASQPAQPAGVPVPLDQMLSPSSTGTSGMGVGMGMGMGMGMAMQPTSTGGSAPLTKNGDKNSFGGAFDDLVSQAKPSAQPSVPKMAQPPKSGDDDLLGLF
jgi:AP-1 complex subunit beta-1